MLRFASALSGAAVVLVVAALALNFYANQQGIGGPPTPTPTPTASPSPAAITGPLPADQTAVIARHVAALNNRDAEAFADVFANDGAFDPRGNFASSSSLFGNTLPIADQFLVESFMSINEAWDYEAEVLTCNQLSKSEYDGRYGLYDDSDLYGHCAVKSRWPALSLEIGEWWAYEFNGTSIVWWGQAVRDPTPADLALPLGLDGLLGWESWLKNSDSEAAARLLNPREFPVIVPCGGGVVYADETHTTTAPPEPPCDWSSDDVNVELITDSERYGRGQHDWTIAGQRFRPSALIPYDPALADEIRASIEEFLLP